MWSRKTRRRLAGLAALALWAGLAATPAAPQAIVSTGESFAEVRLLAGRAEPEGARTVGLEVDLAPGWKTYWRSPGGAGLPPEFDWSGSRNLASAEVRWPRPQLFESFGMETLGYAGRVVLPVRLEPADPARPIGLRLELALGVCRDICVLEERTLTAELAPDTPEEGAALLAAAEAAVPRPAAELGLIEATCRIGGAGRERAFEATLVFERPPEDPVVVLEAPEHAWFDGVETEAEPGSGRLRVAAQLALLDAQAWVGRSDIRMTVLAGDFAADIRGCAAPAG